MTTVVGATVRPAREDDLDGRLMLSTLDVLPERETGSGGLPGSGWMERPLEDAG